MGPTHGHEEPLFDWADETDEGPRRKRRRGFLQSHGVEIGFDPLVDPWGVDRRRLLLGVPAIVAIAGAALGAAIGSGGMATTNAQVIAIGVLSVVALPIWRRYVAPLALVELGIALAFPLLLLLLLAVTLIPGGLGLIEPAGESWIDGTLWFLVLLPVAFGVAAVLRRLKLL